MTVAIITGVTGQDGAYVAQLLLSTNHEVHGTYRRTSSFDSWRIEGPGIANDPCLHLVEYDLSDLGSSIALVHRMQPDEIYNLASQSFVSVSFDQPSAMALVTGIGALHYRERYGIFGSSGILVNHESPLRGSEFVTRKIADGVAEKETAGDAATGRTVVRINPKFGRPAEVGLLTGSSAKAKLGWEPHTTLEPLCQMMVDADLRRNERGVSF